MVTQIYTDAAARLLRLQTREGEDWTATIEHARRSKPGWTVELYVMPANAPPATRDRRGRKLEPVRIVVHTWAPDGTVTVESMEVAL